MNPVQSAVCDPVRNRSLSEAQIHELPATDSTMLPISKPGNRPLVWSDADVRHLMARISFTR